MARQAPHRLAGYYRRGELAHLLEITRGGELFYRLAREMFPRLTRRRIDLELQLWCRFHGGRPPLPKRDA